MRASFWLLGAVLLTTTGCAALAGMRVEQPPPPPANGEFLFTAAGDFGMSPEASATLARMAQSGAGFHLVLGDLSYSSTLPERDWCDYVRSHVGDVPVQLVPGNHEDDFGEDGRIRNFAACLPDRMNSTGAYPEQYYFDHQGLARVIVISPDLTIDGQHYYYGDENAQYQWLVNAIDGARAAGVPWVVVGMHKNCHSVGPYYCNVYEDLLNLLVEKRVDLVLHAHDHTYQRGKQLARGASCARVPVDSFAAGCVADDGLDNRYRKGDGTVAVVVGTGGAPLYEVDAADPEAGYFVTWLGTNRQPRKGFLQMAVSRSELRAELVPSTATSSFADAFTITAAQ